MPIPPSVANAGRIFDNVVSVLKSCLSGYSSPVALHEPYFPGNEWRYVKECIDTHWVSSVGSYVERFENDLSAYTGAKRAIATTNGTAALHMALILAGVKPGDEVLVPTLTFVATANAVSYTGASPHWIDSEDRTFGIDTQKLLNYLRKETEMRAGICLNRITGRPITALIGVHIFGHPFEADKVAEICREFNLFFIEDAAESVGSFYKKKHTGTFARIGVLSFNGNKIITTGGGGAILTDDEDLGKHAKHLTTTAKVAGAIEFEHDEVGYNYRLPNLNAALGCAQLETLEEFIASKRALAERYAVAFERIAGLKFIREPQDSRSNYWLSTILLDSENACRRDELIQAGGKAGFVMRPCWKLMHRLPMYAGLPQMDLSVSEDLARRIINLPSGVQQ